VEGELLTTPRYAIRASLPISFKLAGRLYSRFTLILLQYCKRFTNRGFDLVKSKYTMSGIPVYTQSPINAAMADGTGPRTAAAVPTQGTQSGPNTNTATTTAIPSSASSYPAARPGAPALPAPTSAAQRYAPMQPTLTTRLEEQGPPLPQPGAVPTPPNSMRSNLPPPPKAGEKFIPPPQTAMPQPYPPQMSILPPTNAYHGPPPSLSTSTTTTSSSPYPAALPSDNCHTPRRILEHPPGGQLISKRRRSRANILLHRLRPEPIRLKFFC
jgi:hypothetical protein